MISINREAGHIVISRSEYLYRNGARDEIAYREMGDGSITIPLPTYMSERAYDSTGSTDGQCAVIIIEEIRRRIGGEKSAVAPTCSPLEELCRRMLQHGAHAEGTQDMTGSEIRALLVPFFGEAMIARAVDFICGRESAPPP